MRGETSNPVLRRLDELAGEWEMRAMVGGQVVATGRVVFDWMPETAFLVQHADGDPAPDAPAHWHSNSPLPLTTIIGLDDSGERFTMLYADARGVCRVYQMSLADGVWRVWREAEGFHQRFTGTFSDDGMTITGGWEGSSDGSTWTRDFDQTYHKHGQPDPADQ